MLVSFKFECFKCGEFDHYFNTTQYPSRDFPIYTVTCPICNRLAEYVPFTRGMQPDSFWAGKDIENLGLRNVTSKKYLKNYLKNNNIAQLTSDEVGGHKPSQKTNKEKIEEHLNKPEVIKQRQEFLSKELDKYGVIDGVK
jgi:hypothetical protein